MLAPSRRAGSLPSAPSAERIGIRRFTLGGIATFVDPYRAPCSERARSRPASASRRRRWHRTLANCRTPRPLRWSPPANLLFCRCWSRARTCGFGGGLAAIRSTLLFRPGLRVGRDWNGTVWRLVCLPLAHHSDWRRHLLPWRTPGSLTCRQHRADTQEVGRPPDSRVLIALRSRSHCRGPRPGARSRGCEAVGWRSMTLGSRLERDCRCS
jgi:hypothetical protein